MTKQPAPYTAILPTILCQQPAVILHWLNEQRATGNLPVEIVLDVLIELASRHISPTEQVKPLESTSPFAQLEVYKRALKHTLAYIKQYEDQIPSLSTAFVKALDAVDKLEGK